MKYVQSDPRCKPCPFCGPRQSIVEPFQTDYGGWTIVCGRCGMQSGTRPDWNQEKAIEHWNNRLLENAIRIYCEGVKADFPETAIAMDNIIALMEGKP